MLRYPLVVGNSCWELALVIGGRAHDSMPVEQLATPEAMLPNKKHSDNPRQLVQT